MDKIVYLKEIPPMKSFFGIVLCILGLGLLFFGSGIFIGPFFILGGLNFLSTQGAEIDLLNNKYRSVNSIFEYNFGKWKPCPEFEYISVFKTKQKQKVSAVTASTTITTEVILVNLFYNRNKHITVYSTNNKEEAFKIAEKFNAELNIDILDATEKEKVWL